MKNTLRILSLAVALSAACLSLAQAQHAKISVARAEKVAIAKYHGKIAGKTELENEDGKWQFAVLVKTGKKLREVMVDAKTGRIGSVEIVTAAEEAREKAAEAKKKKKTNGGN